MRSVGVGGCVWGTDGKGGRVDCGSLTYKCKQACF